MTAFRITPAAGGVTSAAGFVAGGVYTGLKTAGEDKLDLGLLMATGSATAAGLFTTNQVKAAPVLVSQLHLRDGRARAVIVNSGCANACTGDQGRADAEEMTRLAASRLDVNPNEVLVASTGVIGVQLDMPKIRAGVGALVLSPQGGADFARAIMTTDTVPKEAAYSVELGTQRFTVGGCAKGAGMIHPDMATMLAFITTDAIVDSDLLQTQLRKAADTSFHAMTIDGDTSTNDSVYLFASGESGIMIHEGSPEHEAFAAALEQTCIALAKAIVRDAEGASKIFAITVEGAASVEDARRAARTIAGSSLVKSAIHGNDPNWGRILAAAGRSGARVVVAKADVRVVDTWVMREGRPLEFDRVATSQAMNRPEIEIILRLNLGSHSATAWGCNLSEEYVTFNSAYTT